MKTLIKAEQVPDSVLIYLDGDNKIWESILDRIGVSVNTTVKPLGIGGHGIAIEIDPKRVLKITDDKTEADAAIILQHNPMPEAYNVSDVFSIKLPYGLRYGIICENLEFPSHEYEKLAKDWNDQTGGFDYLTPENIDLVFGGDKTKYGQSMIWLESAATNLVARNIFYADLKPDNLMRRSNGEHCIIDFGNHSEVPEATVPALIQVASRLVNFSRSR